VVRATSSTIEFFARMYKFTDIHQVYNRKQGRACQSALFKSTILAVR